MTEYQSPPLDWIQVKKTVDLRTGDLGWAVILFEPPSFLKLISLVDSEFTAQELAQRYVDLPPNKVYVYKRNGSRWDPYGWAFLQGDAEAAWRLIKPEERRT